MLAQAYSLTSPRLTPQLTPTESPKKQSGASSPKHYSSSGSPKQHSINETRRRFSSSQPTSERSTAPNSPPKGSFSCFVICIVICCGISLSFTLFPQMPSVKVSQAIIFIIWTIMCSIHSLILFWGLTKGFLGQNRKSGAFGEIMKNWGVFWSPSLFFWPFSYLVTTLKPVPRGTEGAISMEGTLAGLSASLLFCALACSIDQVTSGLSNSHNDLFPCSR